MAEDINTDEGVILEALNDKADRDLNNLTTKADLVYKDMLTANPN